MQFNNWIFKEEGLINTQDPFNRIFVPKSGCNKTIFIDGQEYYQWIIDVVKFDSLSVTDIQNFNVAFTYALGRYNVHLIDGIYNASVNKQKELLSIRRIRLLQEQKLKEKNGT